MDDEPLALLNMENLLKEFESIEVVKTYTMVKDLLSEGPTLDVDVAFLDVEMPDMNGLEIAQLLKNWNKNIFIVFVTAYRDYAVEAFEIQSFDYLLKPILKSRLKIVINRIQELFHQANSDPTLKQKSSLTINCFGEFSVFYEDKVIHWRTVKTKELFVFLFLNLNSYVPRDTIIDSLWNNTDYKKAKIQLHTTVSFLRKTLSSCGYLDVIEYINGCYILKLKDFQCDAYDLEIILNNKLETGIIDIEKAEKFIKNYQGEYMATLAYPWTISEINVKNKQVFQLLDYMADYYSETKDIKNRERILHLILELNPYSDTTVQQLIQHYIEINDRVSIIRIYNNFKRTLLADLNVLPNQETTRLFNEIVKYD